MAGSSLLQRISHPEFATARSGRSEAQLRDAVLQNLRSICTTLQGTVPACPDYGIVCVSELVHAFPDAAAMVARSLKQAIQTYEPRLTNVRVRHVPGEDLTMRFE